MQPTATEPNELLLVGVPGPELDAATAERLRHLWTESRARARTAPAGSPAFARMADLAAKVADSIESQP